MSEQSACLTALAVGAERDYPHNALTSTLAGRALGIPAYLCYEPVPGTDRRFVCGREHGHDGKHNTRHDLTGVHWR